MQKQKLKNIQLILKKQGLDGMLIGNFGHQVRCDMMYYLLLEKLELGAIYIPSHGKPVLWAIPFEVEQLKKRNPAISVKPYNTGLPRLLESKKISGEIGIRESSFPTQVFKSIKKTKFIKLKPMLAEDVIFAIKLPEEITRLKKAASITDKLFSMLIQKWPTFTTEKDAAQFLLLEMARVGVEPSFPPIIASGSNAANPHHGYSKDKIKKGFCVIDMGVRYKGYCSDMTRTLYVGKASAKDYELYTTLLDAQKQSINLVHPGQPIQNIDAFCRNALGKELNKQFIHSLGHGLGTQVHEWPRVSGNESSALTPGMIITIEPGVYKQGSYGIRIEDDVLVTKTGHTIFTKSKKSLIEI